MGYTLAADVNGWMHPTDSAWEVEFEDGSIGYWPTWDRWTQFLFPSYREDIEDIRIVWWGDE